VLNVVALDWKFLSSHDRFPKRENSFPHGKTVNFSDISVLVGNLFFSYFQGSFNHTADHQMEWWWSAKPKCRSLNLEVFENECISILTVQSEDVGCGWMKSHQLAASQQAVRIDIVFKSHTTTKTDLEFNGLFLFSPILFSNVWSCQHSHVHTI
jgi:hypothetical protein